MLVYFAFSINCTCLLWLYDVWHSTQVDWYNRLNEIFMGQKGNLTSNCTRCMYRSNVVTAWLLYLVIHQPDLFIVSCTIYFYTYFYFLVMCGCCNRAKTKCVCVWHLKTSKRKIKILKQLSNQQLYYICCAWFSCAAVFTVNRVNHFCVYFYTDT